MRKNQGEGAKFMLGVDAGKEGIMYEAGIQDPGPRYMHFPVEQKAGYDREYFKGLISEKMVAAILRAQVRAMRGPFTRRPRTPPPTPLAGERRTASPYRSPRQRTAIPRPSPCLQTAIPRPSRAFRLTQAARPRLGPRRIRAVHPAARIPILPSFTQGLRASSAHTE